MEQEKELVIQLYKDHYRTLYDFFLKKLGSHDDAADGVQEAFKRLIGHNGRTEPRSPDAYLFRIAKNLVTDMLRRQVVLSRYIEPVEPEEQAASCPSADAALDTEKQRELIRDAISDLPPRCREVFVLHQLKNLTYHQTAERLNISPNTVKNHYVKALLRLRKVLAGFGLP